ncbi:MAG TPA: IS110 family transposase [Egibacteraceae bacterium]|nr:IS110 family transposase [Egibacteraceae bacterium]
MIFVGIDWSERHHDVEVQRDDGTTVERARVGEGLEGAARLHALLAAHAEDPGEVVIGIETDRGLLVGSLAAAGYQVFAVNPKAVSRYRDRHAMSGAKSDARDAKVLADLVRTDRHNHRPIAGDSDLAAAIKVTARAHQNLIWTRQRQLNQLRNTLRDYYPAALEAFGTDLAHPDAVAVLTKAPTPERGRRLSTAQIASALRRAGRKRNIDSRAAAIRDALRTPQLSAPPAVADAYGDTTKALFGVIGALTAQISELEAALTDRFEQHPDADIYRSLAGLGVILGARVLAEFGDDPDRYADAKARRNYAGSSPITKASGTRRVVLARYVRNRRLADALTWWAFCSLTTSPGARAFYDRHRANGHTHHQALRALSNRWVGILHGCLRHHTPYDETAAWRHRNEQLPTAA